LFKSILVLESPWEEDFSEQAYSVYPFVSEFAKIQGLTSHHRMFYDVTSFHHWLETFNNQNKEFLLYIAGHGTRGRINGLRSNLNFQSIVSEITKCGNLKYAHFSTCGFGGAKNLQSIMENAKQLKWVAGYGKNIDWVDSTLFDISLWNKLLRKEGDENKAFQTLVKEIVHSMPGAVDDLGFNFCYRYGDKVKLLKNDFDW
jgi:hypothetical protein